MRVMPSAHLPSPPLLPPLILSELELEAFQTHGIHFSFRLCEGYKACRAEEMTMVDADKRVSRMTPSSQALPLLAGVGENEVTAEGGLQGLLRENTGGSPEGATLKRRAQH